MAEVSLVKLPSYECHWTISMVSQYWFLTAPSHYLSQCWPRSMSPNGITRQQWVLKIYQLASYYSKTLIHHKALSCTFDSFHWCLSLVFQLTSKSKLSWCQTGTKPLPEPMLNQAQNPSWATTTLVSPPPPPPPPPPLLTMLNQLNNAYI